MQLQEPVVLFHVDIDAFFASVEQIVNPELAGKCVIVGGAGDERSVVAAASYQARAKGIKTAMPLALAKKICPEAYFVPGNFHLYQEFSDRMFAVLYRFTPDLEQASIDEGYLDMTGTRRLFCPHVRCEYWPITIAQRLKEAVKQATGLDVSVGIAHNKLIAKIASKYAKPNGLAMIGSPYQRAFISGMPLEVIPGIGRQSLRQLHAYNLRKVRDLWRMSPSALQGMFGIAGRIMYYHALGLGSAELLEIEPPKSISRGTTFHRDSLDMAFIRSMLYYLTERVCQELRRQDMQGRCVTMTIRYGDFRTVSKSALLVEPTDQDMVVYRKAAELMDKLYTRRMALRLISVALGRLSRRRQRQLYLWDQQQQLKRQRLYAGQDAIREKFGFSALAAGPAIDLLAKYARKREGFVLRTPALSR